MMEVEVYEDDKSIKIYKGKSDDNWPISIELTNDETIELFTMRVQE